MDALGKRWIAAGAAVMVVAAACLWFLLAPRGTGETEPADASAAPLECGLAVLPRDAVVGRTVRILLDVRSPGPFTRKVHPPEVRVEGGSRDTLTTAPEVDPMEVLRSGLIFVPPRTPVRIGWRLVPKSAGTREVVVSFAGSEYRATLKVSSR